MNFDQFLQALADAWPPSRWLGVGVMVGCSGGADSVGLLRGLCELRKSDSGTPPQGFIVAAHFNHAVRGREADQDEAFVRNLADQLQIDCIVERRTLRPNQTSSDEESLRNARLNFLQKHAQQRGVRYVAVGHTAEDNVETVLHHLFRGTGPAGLAGIAPHRCLGEDLVLIRPLLGIQRDPLRAALESIAQTWREDSSNQSCEYRRNWIRHQLIPQVRKAYPDAEAAIARATESQRDWRELVDKLAADWLGDNVRVTTGASTDTEIEVKTDSRTRSTIVIAAMQELWKRQKWPRRDMTMQHWKRLSKSISKQSNDHYQLPGNINVAPHGAGETLLLSTPD